MNVDIEGDGGRWPMSQNAQGEMSPTQHQYLAAAVFGPAKFLGSSTGLDPAFMAQAGGSSLQPTNVQKSSDQAVSGSDLIKAAVASDSKLKSVIIGPSQMPVIPVIPSLYKELSGRALEKIALDYGEEGEDGQEEDHLVNPLGEQEMPEVEHGDDEEIEVEILEKAPNVFQTPRKKKTTKIREHLDAEFLRYSNRLSSKRRGFKNAESAKKFQEEQSLKGKNKEAKTVKEPRVLKNKKVKRAKLFSPEEMVDVTPLASIPPTEPQVAPFLPKDVLHGLGEGFLQIEPTAVSTALLAQDDLDD